MSTALTTTPDTSKLPAAIRKLLQVAKPEDVNELSGGVTSGFPVISIKGKVWRIRKGGEEVMHLDDQNNAMPTIDVVIVQSNPMPSKIFYDKKFEEGTNESPRCFSNDGLKPDASVANPISPICANCSNNVWGSRITDSGKKSRACSDARRMGVVFINELNEQGVDCPKYLLRVPPASLNPLKDFAEKTLAPKGIPFYAIVTRIGFDPTAAHPQMTFKAARFLSEAEAEAVIALRGSQDIMRILAEAQDFPAGGTADPAEPSPASSAHAPAVQTPATTPPAAKATKKPVLRPASEEEAGADTIPEAAPPAAAAPPPAAAKPPKAAKPKPAAPPPVVAATEDEDEIPAAGAPAAKPAAEEFDNLLDSILNG